MNHSDSLLETSLPRIPKWMLWGYVAVAFLGLLDASYLTMKDYAGGGIACFVFTGCDDVLKSQYNNLFGIPVALFGALFYFGMLFLSLLYIDVRKGIILGLMMLGSIAGFLFSIGFVYLQLFVIKAICSYCMLSALTSTTIFLLSVFTARKIKKHQTLRAFIFGK